MGAPAALDRRRSMTLRHLFLLDQPPAAKLPQPQPDPAADELLVAVSSCFRVFTFVDPGECALERDLKSAVLESILGLVRSENVAVCGRVVAPLLMMLAANLLRPLPPPVCPWISSDDIDDEVPHLVLSPAWPHRRLAYDILLAVVSDADAKTLQRYVSRAFLSGLVGLFASEDPRERGCLKNVYHKLYSKLMGERSFMRRSMSTALLQFAYQDADAGHRQPGVSELLEIWGSIVTGFVVPLKEEHRAFLRRVLLPLYRPWTMPAYHRHLAYCVRQLVIKEPELAGVAVASILRCWPVTNCAKEVLLIAELEELTCVLDHQHFAAIASPLCTRIARCSSSCNSQVAERALYVWNNEKFFELASPLMEAILPPFVAAIEKNLKLHWSNSVRQVTASVKSLLEEKDPFLYSVCLQQLRRQQSEARRIDGEREAMWKALETAATRR